MKAVLKWKDAMTFEATVRQHSFNLDTSTLGGKDTGPSPKEYLLSSIAVCSGMDVVALMKKHKIEMTGFDLSSQGETRDAHPKIFKQVDLVFDLKINFKDKSVELPKVIESVNLSMRKFCGVSAMVNPTSPIFYTVMINGEIEHRDQAKFIY